jgi:hypothetical protein
MLFWFTMKNPARKNGEIGSPDSRAASWLTRPSDHQPGPRDDGSQELADHPVRRLACAPAAVIGFRLVVQL